MYEKILLTGYFGILLIMSVAALILFSKDKAMAGSGMAVRIKEKTLLAVSVYGGGIGAFLGRILFHHKTRKIYFSIVINLSVLIQLAVLVFLFLRVGGIVG